ncbi:MAG TPA: hypothetical protein VL356_11715 [Acidocella sp.]|nr:hypothetical protein [Acidocella sp.]
MIMIAARKPLRRADGDITPAEMVAACSIDPLHFYVSRPAIKTAGFSCATNALPSIFVEQ